MNKMAEGPGHRGLVAMALTLGLLLGPGWVWAMAQDQQAENLLDSERWVDETYGLSLRPPLGTKLIEQTGDDALLRIIDADKRYSMSVAVRRAGRELTLREVMTSAKAQIKQIHPATELDGQERIKVGQLAGAMLHFRVPYSTDKVALISQCVIQLNPRAYVLVEIRGQYDQADRLRQLHEAVVHSIDITDLDARARRRGEAIERTQKWRKTVTPEELKAAARGAEYYRMLHGSKDIGYMIVERQIDEFAGKPMVRVSVATRVDLDRGRMDSMAEMYRPLDQIAGEAWSVRTTFRPDDRRREARTAAKTGATTLAHVTVTTDGTGGAEAAEKQYARPEVGYLPQAEAWLLPQLLPTEQTGEYGFYWYDDRSDSIVFRSDRVTPTLEGFVITTRLSHTADQALRATYDSQGRLIEKELGGERKLVGSDLRTLKVLWKLR